MSARENGGPAFPNDADRYGNSGADGMSLRDWFAGQALAGLLAEPQPEDGEPELGLGRDYAANVAAAAYRLSDAMLAARSKP